MSLCGYKKKTKPALWMSAGIGVKKPAAKPEPQNRFKKQAKPKALWTDLPEAKRKRELDVLSKGLRKPKPSRAFAIKPKDTPEKKLYRVEAREFVRAAIAAGGRCPVVAAVDELRNGRKYGHPISDELNEVHHIRGRLGSLLRDQRFWIALSKQGHRWVHEHIDEARRLGFICQPGEWNTPPQRCGA